MRGIDMAIATSPVDRAFSMYREMFASAGGEATIEHFRFCYDKLFDAFALPDDAVISEVSAGGVRSLLVTVKGVPVERTVLYLHGGGFMCGNPEGVRDLCIRLARAAHAEVLAVDYRLAPEHAHPAPVEDALAAYRYLVGAGRSAGSISIVGDSCGGGLAVATAVALREAGDPGPAALVCFSPWVDMEGGGETFATRADVDPVVSRETLLMSAQAYLQGQDACSPLANVLHADLRALPPLLIQVGSEEVLLDDSVRLARRAGEAQVDVTLQIQPGMPHVYQYFASFLPEAQESIEQAAAFTVDRTNGGLRAS
jgi:acetyl esterase/lipase